MLMCVYTLLYVQGVMVNQKMLNLKIPWKRMF